MYTIANKHNKKTRKLSSSSRNKHKSKSKNKRKHKYTIGKTRKYTKSHNTIHIGGLGKGKGRQAVESTIDYSAPLSESERAAQRRVSERLKQARQSQSQDQSGVTVSDSGRVPTSRSPRMSAAPSRISSTGTVTEYDIPLVSPRITEETRLKTPQENMAEEVKQRAEAEAKKKAEEEKLRAEAEAAKKKAREERLNKKKEDMKIESEKMYNKFITTINNYEFETSVDEPYIRFSKFIQEIMDLQFNIKDDEFRKKAQNITDQILTAYSALISYNCSTKFLKQHFQDYMGKLKSQNKLQKTIKIVDPTEPTPKIDDQVSSIIPKLVQLASAQVCDHPLSEHLVKEPVTDSDSPFFRFPSFTIPSFNNPFKRSSQLPEITPTASTPKASAASAYSPDNNDQNDKATTNPSSPPPGSVIQLKTFGDNLDQEPEEGRGRTRTSFDKLSSSLRGTTRTSAAAPPRTNANANASRRAPASNNRSVSANLSDRDDNDDDDLG